MRQPLCRLIIALNLALSLFVTGCGEGSAYDKMMSYKASEEELKLLSEGRLAVDYEYEYSVDDFDNIVDYLKYVAAFHVQRHTKGIRAYAPYIIGSSLALGLLIFFTARKSIQIRKWAFFVLILGIPIATFIFIYGTAFLLDSLQR